MKTKLGAHRRRKATVGNPRQRVATADVGDRTIPTATPGSGYITKTPVRQRGRWAPSGRSFMEKTHGRVHAIGEADSKAGGQGCASLDRFAAAVVGLHLAMAGRSFRSGPSIVSCSSVVCFLRPFQGGLTGHSTGRGW